MPAPLSRRDLLARSTTLAALGATGAVAGCTELDVLGGAGTDFRTRLRRWLPATAAMPDADGSSTGYYFAARDLSAVRAGPDRFAELVGSTAGSALPALGIDPADLELTLSVAFTAAVHVGDVDGEAVAETLRAEGLERSGRDGDFVRFRGELSRGLGNDQARPHTVAVRDGAVAISPSAADRADPLGPILAAREGDTRRYAEADDGVEALLGAAAGLMGVNGRAREPIAEQAAEPATGNFANLVASGSGFDAADDTIRLHSIVVFEDADAVDESAIESYVAERTAPREEQRFPNYEHHDTTVDGRVARIVFEAPLSGLPTPTDA